MEDITLWNVQQRQSPYTRQSGDHSCVAKIGFTYLNIIKTENKRKSLIDFFEIERFCLFLATLLLPNIHSLFISRKEKWRHFLISASVLVSKTTSTQWRGCLSLAMDNNKVHPLCVSCFAGVSGGRMRDYLVFKAERHGSVTSDYRYSYSLGVSSQSCSPLSQDVAQDPPSFNCSHPTPLDLISPVLLWTQFSLDVQPWVFCLGTTSFKKHWYIFQAHVKCFFYVPSSLCLLTKQKLQHHPIVNPSLVCTYYTSSRE